MFCISQVTILYNRYEKAIDNLIMFTFLSQAIPDLQAEEDEPIACDDPETVQSGGLM